MSIYFKHECFEGENQKIRHAFFGSQGGVSKGVYSSLNCGAGSDDHPANIRANKVTALESLGLEQTILQTVHQIHSNECVIVSGGEKKRAEADAMVTDVAGQTLGILTADCTPVLFYGEKKNGAPVIGAAHAGWKGAISGVLQNTLEKMKEKGAVEKSFRAVIGPTIGSQSYEVGQEFKDIFLNKDRSYESFFNLKDSSIYFDLPSFCKDRLEMAGVRDVFMKNLDTFYHEDDFFSYRRATHRKDKDYGRQISLISII